MAKNRRLIDIATQECIIQIGLLLEIQLIKWPEDLYTLYLGMVTAQNKMKGATREQCRVALGAWLRVYKRVLDMLPADHPVRLKAEPEFERISKPYKGLLNVSNSAGLDAGEVDTKSSNQSNS